MPADMQEVIDTARAIKTVAYEAGYQSGYEAGLRKAQTTIDAAAAEHGRTEERGRCEALAIAAVNEAREACRNGATSAEIVRERQRSQRKAEALLSAIRSGEPAPEAK